MIDIYVKRMGRHYNLTQQQEEYTRELLGQRVKQFLTDYEKDVRWLATEMWDYQAKGELPPPEIAKEWGLRAQALLPAIRQEIIDGNNKWHEILNDDQRRQHDRDMELMSKQFDRWQGMFDRWSKGEIQSSDFDPRGDSRVSQPRGPSRSENSWEQYVKNFIAIYNLDSGQQQTALSVLRTLREEAARYRDAHKDEYSKLEAEEAAMAKAEPKTDHEDLKKSMDQARERMEHRRRLEKPIGEMFVRLKNQLERIPTGDQRRARQAAMDKLAAWSRRGSTKPAVITSAPASTQPEAAEASATQPETDKKPASLPGVAAADE